MQMTHCPQHTNTWTNHSYAFMEKLSPSPIGPLHFLQHKRKGRCYNNFYLVDLQLAARRWSVSAASTHSHTHTLSKRLQKLKLPFACMCIILKSCEKDQRHLVLHFTQPTNISWPRLWPEIWSCNSSSRLTNRGPLVTSVNLSFVQPISASLPTSYIG